MFGGFRNYIYLCVVKSKSNVFKLSLFMVKSCIEYNGKSYPTIEISLCKVSDIVSDAIVILADYGLWDAIEDDYMNDMSEANGIDDMVYYYCDYGFIDKAECEDDVASYLYGEL